MRKILISTLMFFAAVSPTLAADFGDLAGTYSGKTAKGRPVQVIVPKSGTPIYRFGGDKVAVNSATVSGKTIKLNVGSAGGLVTLTSNGKGQMSYKYAFQGATASAILARQ